MKVSRGDSLDRYYLFKLFGYGVFLHRIHHSDPPGVYHNHPWSGLSLIFGVYAECFPDGDFEIRTLWNWIPATRYHRVVVGQPVWTLFIHGRKCNEWSIIDEKGNKVDTPWEGAGQGRSYTAALKTGTSENG